MKPRLLVITALTALSAEAFADHHAKKPPANSNERARPEVITPGTASTPAEPGKPPSDAIVLFDGKNLDAFTQKGKEPQWKVENGYAEVTRTGEIVSKQSFGDAQLHIEWAAPSEVKGSGQGRGNSGVYLGNYCEVQVLDSFENDTYPGGQASALYGKTPPLVNASRKPGEWQTYDIILHTAKGDQPAHITVLHNGVVVHHAYPLGKKSDKWNLKLQDHGNPVRYRNIWVRELEDYK